MKTNLIIMTLIALLLAGVETFSQEPVKKKVKEKTEKKTIDETLDKGFKKPETVTNLPYKNLDEQDGSSEKPGELSGNY